MVGPTNLNPYKTDALRIVEPDDYGIQRGIECLRVTQSPLKFQGGAHEKGRMLVHSEDDQFIRHSERQDPGR